MCIRQIYECNQLHRYILCVAVVIVCNDHWEQGIQIELTRSPNQCQHHLNYINRPCPELSFFTVTVFQNFRFECMCDQRFVGAARFYAKRGIKPVQATLIPLARSYFPLNCKQADRQVKSGLIIGHRNTFLLMSIS